MHKPVIPGFFEQNPGISGSLFGSGIPGNGIPGLEALVAVYLDDVLISGRDFNDLKRKTEKNIKDLLAEAKDLISTKSVLAHSNEDLPILVNCDASELPLNESPGQIPNPPEVFFIESEYAAISASEVARVTGKDPILSRIKFWAMNARKFEDKYKGYFTKLHIDHAGPFQGKLFLVAVDAYSKWIEAKIVESTSAETTVNTMGEMFATHGLPDVIVTDNGTSFTSEVFKTFLKRNGIRHILCAPYHTASNGQVEIAIQTFKNLLRKNSRGNWSIRLARSLLTMRIAVNSTTRKSPAQLLMNRNLKTIVGKFYPESISEGRNRQDDKFMKNWKPHREVEEGQEIMARGYHGSRWLPGVVSEKTGPVSIKVETEDGKLLSRHLDQVRSCGESEALPSTSSTPQVTPEIERPPAVQETDSSEGTPKPVLRRSLRIRKPPSFFENLDKTKFVQIEAISGKEDETQVSIPSRGGPKTRQQLKELLESIPNFPLEEAEHLGLDKDEELPMSFRLASINVRGLAARERSIELCHFLTQHRIDVAFVQETNTSSLNTIQDLCLGYLAAVVPPTAIRGSGLACIFAPGVAVLGQRILWPGHISVVSLDVHGQEVSVINCHLSHIPRERHQQLQIIAATAVQENSWVLGDLNINEESTNDTASGSVEALSELLDQTALVDVAILFDATHIPTRVASYGSRVDASRYRTIELSFFSSECLLHLDNPAWLQCYARGSLSNIWQRSSKEHQQQSRISDNRGEAGLQSRLTCWQRRFLQARLEAASTEADYPSLPNLWHTLRMCRPARTNFRDEEGNIIEGTELRRKVYSILQRRFASQSCDSNAATEFIQGTTTPLILEDDDPLLRSEITATEIATAIRRLPLEGPPDRTTCPASSTWPTRNSSTICLVPKSHGGPGLCGYRPISLPTTDYRILGDVLLRRLRPHLPVLVPQCQTYAVPGRSPSWNISRVRDEVDAAVRTGSPLAVISTDLESAFDTLDRGFLVSLMVSLRLPQVFIGWFLLLYAGADATVRAGGLHTKPFQLLNGVRQGCAISAEMFSLATSPLLRRLEQALGPGNVLAYADDIVLLIRSEEQFGVVTSIFENFRRASGIKGNFTKSKGLWCGAWRARNDAPLGISWSSVELKVLGCNVTPGNQNSAQERHILVLLEAAITRWSPYTRGLSLVGRPRAANSLVLSSVVHHIHGYLPTDRTIHKIQARLARFIWGPERTAWFPGSVLARPVSLGGFGLIDIETQLRLSCFKGVQAALRGNRNAYSWLVESDAWLYPPPSGSWLSPRRLRLLKIWEAVADIFTLDHSVLTPHQLLNFPIIGGCRLLRPPDLLAPTRWVNACIRDFAGPAPPLTRPTRCALADAASLTSFCRRLIDENLRGTYRVNTIGQAVVLRGTTTPFLRVITRTARRISERPRLTALPIIQFARRWEENINLPINIGWLSLRRCAFSGHKADVAVRLALHALPHPAHPAPAHQSCIACGSDDLSLVHRYWSCRYIRPLIREAFTIIGRPPDLQGWVFGHGLDDDALAILASAKTRIYRHFLGAELRSVQEDPLLVWRRTLSRPLTALPESNDDDVPINYLDRWSLNKKIKNVFWKRWNREYLNNLQQRLKWQKSSPNIKEGDLILLKDAILPPAMYWSLGRITKVFPGTDGKVRVVEVKTKHQEHLTTTVSKIVPLPFAED
ncbi:K02A2.6-like [Cordylochernes scorpioides]|uniref:K02A2.6-like n=1 Tax=Cordylochernes scorpioides TaxID=51811 RepID=A0ABY6LBM5_9ARAC|nr:K02A2.6-like [Cordylochernes scorpioides]